jgi:hypothetical protein
MRPDAAQNSCMLLQYVDYTTHNPHYQYPALSLRDTHIDEALTLPVPAGPMTNWQHRISMLEPLVPSKCFSMVAAFGSKTITLKRIAYDEIIRPKENTTPGGTIESHPLKLPGLETP